MVLYSGLGNINFVYITSNCLAFSFIIFELQSLCVAIQCLILTLLVVCEEEHPAWKLHERFP